MFVSTVLFRKWIFEVIYNIDQCLNIRDGLFSWLILKMKSFSDEPYPSERCVTGFINTSAGLSLVYYCYYTVNTFGNRQRF